MVKNLYDTVLYCTVLYCTVLGKNKCQNVILDPNLELLISDTKLGLLTSDT